jgi:uncharacterized RDD family membrane protein YckC
MNDDLQFRPISKGLGFHQPKDVRPHIGATTPTTRNTISAQTSSANNLLSRTNPPSLKRSSSLVRKSMVSEAIASTEQLVEDRVLLSSATKVSLLSRFMSWAIDITALVLLMAASSALIFQLNNFSWDEPLQFFHIDFFWNLYLPLGLGFYMFYFMLFERVTGQTLGKLIMGLKVVRLNSDLPPTLWQSFLRNIFNLASLATLGLLTIYDVVNWSLNLKVKKVQ